MAQKFRFSRTSQDCSAALVINTLIVIFYARYLNNKFDDSQGLNPNTALKWISQMQG